MEISDFEKNYLQQKTVLEHSRLVENLSMKMFQKLLKIFPYLEKYNNKTDLKILKYAAFLHDVGFSFEDKMDKGHHKIGRNLILQNKISDLSDTDNLVTANIVRYHRRALPSVKHKYYEMLDEENRKKTDIFASIVRLCDAFDYKHFNIVDDFEIELNKNKQVLTIKLPVNIMLNVGLEEILNKKKQLFEKTFALEVLFT